MLRKLTASLVLCIQKRMVKYRTDGKVKSLCFTILGYYADIILFLLSRILGFSTLIRAFFTSHVLYKNQAYAQSRNEHFVSVGGLCVLHINN